MELVLQLKIAPIERNLKMPLSCSLATVTNLVVFGLDLSKQMEMEACRR